MVVLEDGKYDYVSDFDDDTLSLITACDGANSDSDMDMEVMGELKLLINMRVLLHNAS
jgi:hypothetical protein